MSSDEELEFAKLCDWHSAGYSVVVAITDRCRKPHPLGFDQTCDRLADRILPEYCAPLEAKESVRIVRNY